jgi:hypothetical protein
MNFKSEEERGRWFLLLSGMVQVWKNPFFGFY